MSIRRIGGGSPFVSLPPAIQRERRIDPVKSYVRTGDTQIQEGEEVDEAGLPVDPDAERRQQQGRELRSQLLKDAYEQHKEELMDLKGGEGLEASEADLPEGAGTRGLSVGDLLRSSSFAAANRAPRYAAPEPSPQEGPVFDEGPFLGARAEEEEPEYEDPGANGFFASVDDVAQLEQPAPRFDPALDGFLASDEDLPTFPDEPGSEAAVEALAALVAQDVSTEALASLVAGQDSTEALMAGSEGDVPVREEGALAEGADFSTQALMAGGEGELPFSEPMDSFEPAPPVASAPAAKPSEHPVADEFAELASVAAEAVAAEAAEAVAAEVAEAMAAEKAPAPAAVGLPFDEAEPQAPQQDWGPAVESPPPSPSVGLPFDET
jgi:hypothetical protein